MAAVTSGVVLGSLQARTLAGPVAELSSRRVVCLTASGLTLLVTLALLRRHPPASTVTPRSLAVVALSVNRRRV